MQGGGERKPSGRVEATLQGGTSSITNVIYLKPGKLTFIQLKIVESFDSHM
jgi:hypothetical protein